MGAVLLLAGKPPKPGTILAEVAALLGRAGLDVSLALPNDRPPQGVTEPPTRDIQDGGVDLVVHRGLGPASSAVARYGMAGHELCNPWPAVGQDGDRVAILRALAAAGVPVPLSTRVDSWAEVRALACDGVVVVKRTRGAGRGQEVTSTITAEPPFDGPYVVEPWIPNDGLDRKLYVAGDEVFGLLKPSTLSAEHGGPAEPFEVSGALRELGAGAAHAVGLHLCGVDVVLGSRGPVVVDVNPFPGYRGIPGAPRAVADHLLTHL